MVSAILALSLAALALKSLGCDAAKATRIVRFLDEAGVVQRGQPNGDTSHAELVQGDLFGDWELSGHIVKVKKVLSPLEPKSVPAVYAIGLNYVKHCLDFNYSIPKEPVIFFKNRKTIANPGDDVFVPKISTMPDYEAELSVVISKDVKDVSEDDALDYVLGYSITNDVSGRCWQAKSNGPDPKGFECPGNGGQWDFSKSFDSHMPFGPVLVSPNGLPTRDAKGLNITMHLNGEQVQSDNTTGMIFSVAQCIAFMSAALNQAQSLLWARHLALARSGETKEVSVPRGTCCLMEMS
jgi:2-keto-4-pentenoate hydratase/2-oxohepta-3-ene-1,7-dioic acid hydratase in catechol pathway